MRMHMIVLLYLSAVAVPALSQTSRHASGKAAFEPTTARERAEMAVCLRHFRVIGQAIKAYRRDRHQDPPHLGALYPRYVHDPSVLHCPRDRWKGKGPLNASYGYNAGSE